MADIDSLKRAVKICLLDQYGTVVGVQSAKSAGMHTAFINRRQLPFGITPHQPDIRVRAMTELADLLV